MLDVDRSQERFNVNDAYIGYQRDYWPSFSSVCNKSRDALGSATSTSRVPPSELSKRAIERARGMLMIDRSGIKHKLDRTVLFRVENSACSTPVAQERLGLLVYHFQDATTNRVSVRDRVEQ